MAEPVNFWEEMAAINRDNEDVCYAATEPVKALEGRIGELTQKLKDLGDEIYELGKLLGTTGWIPTLDAAQEEIKRLRLEKEQNEPRSPK